MQLRALHEFTALLPRVEPAFPELPYGRNTSEAMQIGVCRGVAGAVRGLVEGYATSLNRWPQLIATGGDVEFMAPYCDYIDTCVSRLTLRGLGLAYSRHLLEQGA
jgi:type III pantothenate kinase